MRRKPEGPAWAWFAGRLVPFTEARVPIEDRGVQFGESLYEVVAVVAGEPFRLDDHVERMQAGGRELGLDAGVPGPSAWRGLLAKLHHREPHRTAVLYAQLSGGSAPREHLPPPVREPLFFAYLRHHAFPVPADAARGIAAATTPDGRWRRRDLKTTMLLPNVLAKQEAAARGAQEAILVGQDGFINEGASSSVFLVRNREVLTPPAGERLLPSVSCLAVAEICRSLDVGFAAQPLTLSDLHRADEVFVASTTSLLMPVVRLDGDPVGTGAPGSLTLQLAYHFQRAFWGEPPAGDRRRSGP